MAQHDYIIANQSGAAFRADLNNGLAAIVSQNSGAAQPTTTYAYQWWADTTTGLLKIRNAANNAWITIGTLADVNLGLATLASPTFTGTVTIPAGASISGFAPLASPTFTGTPTVPSLNGGPLAGFRNRIINGNFDIWQRGTSFTGNEYGADRWLHGRVGTTHTVTRQAFTLGQTEVPGEPTYFCRTVVSSVAGAGNYALLQQKIEDVRTFAGQQITISFWAKVDATKNIAINMVQNFGTGGSPSANVGISGTKVSIGTTFQKVTVTTTVPSISGKTLGTDNNHSLQLNIWFDAGSTYNGDTDSLGQQSGTFDIAQVQIEPGSVATPFERRPIGNELVLCQRYFAIIYVSLQGTSVAGVLEYTAKFPQTMRAIPSTTGFQHASYASSNVSSETLRQWSSSEIGYGISGTANTDMYVLGRGYFLNAEL
jgi:hypothetical protein